MKYRLKTNVPYVGVQGHEITSDKYGWFVIDDAEEHDHKKPSFKPAMFPDLFEPIKPKRVLVIEYEIIPDTIQVDWSQREIRESLAQEYVSMGFARIKERY